MNTRPASAADQSFPDSNRQWKRFLAGEAAGKKPFPLAVSRARRVAEREWGRVTRGTAR
jgi:hypothetical protein